MRSLWRLCFQAVVTGCLLWGATAVAAEPVASLAAVWSEAEQLRSAGQYRDASQRYQEIVSWSVRWKERQRATLLAADCLQRSGSNAEAISLYDAVIAEADQESASRRSPSDGYWTQVALLEKARLCKAVGDTAQARQTIERLRAEFPKSPHALEATELRARLDGVPFEPVRAREAEALQLAEQGAQLFQSRRNPEALLVFRRILSEYPDTAAVYPALRSVALILSGEKAWDESRQVYSEIVERVGGLAPNSRLVSTARRRIAWVDSTSQFKRLLDQRLRGGEAPDAEWEQVRRNCAIVAELTSDPLERAQARLIAIEAYYWQGDSARTLAAADEFVNAYGTDKKYRRFKREIAAARFMLADSLRQAGRFEEALAQYRWIIDAHQAEDPIDMGTEILARLYYRVWWTLGATGASQEELSKIERTLISILPGSGYVKAIEVIKKHKEPNNAR